MYCIQLVFIWIVWSCQSGGSCWCCVSIQIEPTDAVISSPLLFSLLVSRVVVKSSPSPVPVFSYMDKYWFWHAPWLIALSSLSARPIKLNLIPLRCWRRIRKERKREKSQEKEIIGPYWGYLSLLSYIDIDDSFPSSSRKILRLTQ